MVDIPVKLVAPSPWCALHGTFGSVAMGLGLLGPLGLLGLGRDRVRRAVLGLLVLPLVAPLRRLLILLPLQRQATVHVAAVVAPDLPGRFRRRVPVVVWPAIRLGVCRRRGAGRWMRRWCHVDGAGQSRVVVCGGCGNSRLAVRVLRDLGPGSWLPW